MGRFRKPAIALALAVLTTSAFACGDSDDDGDDAAGGDEPAAATTLDISAADYSFVLPTSAEGGTVELTLANTGQEPHFAGFARVADGATFEDVQAALTAPPSAAPPTGPPPFEEVAGIPVVDPGGSSTATVELPAGEYAVFCALPSPDGTSHAAKGMVQKITITEGSTGELPEADASVVGTDFAFDSTPQLAAGENQVKLRNEGQQLHEVALIKLSDGTSVDDVVAWFEKPGGPPPMSAMGGVAVKPGTEGVANFNLEAGSTYAIICAIPDVRGDFAAHVTKGMRTEAITV